MHAIRSNALPLLKETVFKWNTDNCFRLGASLSYYTLFSLFPLILVVLAITRVLLENSDVARDAILDALASVTGGFRKEFADALIAASRTRVASGIAGTAVLIVGASWVFGELVSAFNVIWGVETPASGGIYHFIRRTFFSFALVLAGAFLLLVSMILSAILAALGTYLSTLSGGYILWRIVYIVINLCVLTGIFALLFKFVPMTYVAWRDVWIGAMLTAVVWTVLQLAIAYYIAFSHFENYGAIGSVLALIVWVYASAQVLFLGGEFTNVYAHHYGSRAHVRVVRTSREEGSERGVPVAKDTASRTVHRQRHSGDATGLVTGMLGTVGLALMAWAVSIQRAARRLWPW